MLKTLAAYAGAVIGAFLLGSILVTQFNLAQVAGMGMDVTLAVRLQATLHDISGLAGTYLPLIAVAFLIALLVATGLLKVFPSQPQLLYLLAGGIRSQDRRDKRPERVQLPHMAEITRIGEAQPPVGPDGHPQHFQWSSLRPGVPP